MLKIVHAVRSASMGAAMACVAGIFLVTIYDIFMRSIASPTSWGLDSTSYLLCFSIGAALPAVTIDGGHVAISFVDGLMSRQWSRRITRVLSLISAVACACAAVVLVDTALSQFASGITTVTTFTFPKWALTAAIAYGFGTSAIIFLLNALSAQPLLGQVLKI
jgi:TRAP-type C4-dicarboxylate transport system permease small subunit